MKCPPASRRTTSASPSRFCDRRMYTAHTFRSSLGLLLGPGGGPGPLSRSPHGPTAGQSRLRASRRGSRVASRAPLGQRSAPVGRRVLRERLRGISVPREGRWRCRWPPRVLTVLRRLRGRGAASSLRGLGSRLLLGRVVAGVVPGMNRLVLPLGVSLQPHRHGGRGFGGRLRVVGRLGLGRHVASPFRWVSAQGGAATESRTCVRIAHKDWQSSGNRPAVIAGGRGAPGGSSAWVTALLDQPEPPRRWTRAPSRRPRSTQASCEGSS